MSRGMKWGPTGLLGLAFGLLGKRRLDKMLGNVRHEALEDGILVGQNGGDPEVIEKEVGREGTWDEVVGNLGTGGDMGEIRLKER